MMQSGKNCNIAEDFIHGENFRCGDCVITEKNVTVGNNVTIGNFVILKEGTQIGDNVTIENFVVLKSGVKIGENSIIEDYSLVLENSHIGSNTKLGIHTKVGKNVFIGDNCNFTAFCEIRDECKLGNNVSMGSRCTLSAGWCVEDNVIMKYSFVATDTPVVGQENVKKVGILKKGSRFGANVTIMPGVTIGENAEIGACSQVRNDVPANEIWYGNPARFFKRREC